MVTVEIWQFQIQLHFVDLRWISQGYNLQNHRLEIQRSSLEQTSALIRGHVGMSKPLTAYIDVELVLRTPMTGIVIWNTSVNEHDRSRQALMSVQASLRIFFSYVRVRTSTGSDRIGIVYWVLSTKEGIVGIQR